MRSEFGKSVEKLNPFGQDTVIACVTAVKRLDKKFSLLGKIHLMFREKPTETWFKKCSKMDESHRSTTGKRDGALPSEDFGWKEL